MAILQINLTDCITYYLPDISVFLHGYLHGLASLENPG